MNAPVYTPAAERRARWGGALLLACAIAACGHREPTEIEVEVRSVGFDAASRSPVVVLQDHTHKRALPIWIGPTEAQSIAMQMQGVNPPRPMTHDLIKAILDQAGVTLDKVVIEALKESTYYARIHLHAGRHDLAVDSRPSDAIALAVRFQRPIFVATALLNTESAINLQNAAAQSTVKLSGVTVQNISDELAQYFSVPAGKGVLVADIDTGAPTSLQRGDIILEIDGAAVSGVDEFERRMHGLKHGAAVQLSVQRGTTHMQMSFTPSKG